MNGATAIARALRAAGVEVAFGLPGAHNLALWPACADAGIRVVGMRTEQGCAHAADGYARSTGNIGVALVTTGPGAAHTVGAVGEAWAARTPLLVVATDIAGSLRRPGVYRGVLHECTDQAVLFAPVTKARYVGVTGVHDALASVTAAPVRPVYLGVPCDELGAPADATELVSGSPGGVREQAGGRAPDLRRAVDAVAASARPLLWIGGGARDAADEIDALARRLGAPVVTTFGARGLLGPDHPLLVSAPPHEPEVTALVGSADLVIVVGSDLDQMNTMQWRLPLPRARVAINIDAADAAKNYAMDAVVVADARAAGLLASAVPARPAWAGDLAELGRRIRARIAHEPSTREAVSFLTHTESSLPADVVVFADMCVAGYWVAGHLRVGRRGLHYPMGWGTLGFALPAAIGAAAVRPDGPVVAFVGDGGALFGLGELSTLAQQGSRCVIVVVDDSGYGMLRHGAVQGPAVDAANDLNPVDFVLAARAFGLPAAGVDGVRPDYADALAAAVRADHPTLLHVQARLHPPVTTTPFWPIRDQP